jgi:hypothetical protein
VQAADEALVARGEQWLYKGPTLLPFSAWPPVDT